ncbi:hypothetical protein [Rhodococcus pseudokoreensis]|uniref:hypothetical protein n=1 Tax=Rhodococcus pseudokoreensis TaxID=2811421 RepID=UPI001F126D71|nr:hypothetical protein [Rhodococcus pseudokoreensis]
MDPSNRIPAETDGRCRRPSPIVYVISNQGALGPNAFKIGTTWHLDRTDRVRELGSASVPSPFHTHARYFSHARRLT